MTNNPLRKHGFREVSDQTLYQSAPGLGHDSRVFSALVNLGGAWQTAFVVNDDLPAE
jgi:hypothetical protein